MAKKFWEIKNKTDDISEILIYGNIVSRSWDEDDWTAKELNEALSELDDIDELHIRINSGGGNAFQGISIYNSLKKYKKENDVTLKSYIEGIAASISSVIPLAASEVIMAKNSLYMIHLPFAMATGTAEDMRKRAELLEQVAEILINTYEEKTGLDREDLKDMMSEETWMESDIALEKGFIDEVEDYSVSASVNDNSLVMNSVEFDLDNFNNVPDSIKQISNKVNNKQKGDDNMAYKEFETEEKFEELKNDLKEKTLKGYVKAEDVLDKFADIDLEGDNLDDIVDKAKEIKDDLEETNEKYQKQQKDILFAKRKGKLEKVGVEVKDEEKEEILNMTKGQLKMLIKSNKEKLENSNNDVDDDLDGDFMNINLDNDELEDIAEAL